MSVLNIGTRALQANQVALQTTGNNIANVNTPGYSRQSVVMRQVEGQYTGGGYLGKGVDIQTIQRNFSAFLTRQAAMTTAVSAGDTARADKLTQLEGIFPGGKDGLGASITDMLNAFSDVASAPTDLTARTVALTRIDETASRMRSAAQSLDELQSAVKQELSQKVDAVNTLAQGIAEVNDEIARALGTGQSPNDLLDRRDQLVRELNQYVQTTSIAADDGTVGIFLAGSQALVLGNTASPVSLVDDEFGDTLKSKLAITQGNQTITLDENALGGGEVSGLLRFQNSDLIEGRNLLGRLTLAISTEMNAQHRLGLDLDGNFGGDLFTPININTPQNVLNAAGNQTTGSLTLAITDPTQFAASDYEVTFSSTTDGTITRKSDGKVYTFPQSPAPASGALANVDGLDIFVSAGATAPTTPQPGDRFLIKPFATSASNIDSVFSTPRNLAVASPVAGLMGTTNKGSLKLVSLTALTSPMSLPTPVTFTFTSATTYTRSDTGATSYTYTPGQAINANGTGTGWTFTLQGAAQTGDTFQIIDIKDPLQNKGVDFRLNAGNATALTALRDKALFDQAPLTDGFASMISQIGIRTQSATYASQVSGSIAANVEKERTAVSGVNLDEEAARLIQYQQAYQASAKVIQIAQNIFDTLIQGMTR
ncbi:flagellar hook-associated protein FlgK [Curvibacter sp. APW13]|uniref:flagellar hook-associated protein FlgK n=1 Tax=Curvibacter sp. APW13 TaxID=3077236 RepID=UPI0028E07742|nr:flagellar hook-associated protein FlgK [Curvibacter sp. APW13]MDT8993048.1 flagellar hook-associated protein FlgK [Curvibacter sp. APW13]